MKQERSGLEMLISRSKTDEMSEGKSMELNAPTVYKSDLAEQAQGCIDELNKLSAKNHELAVENQKLKEKIKELEFRLKGLDK